MSHVFKFPLQALMKPLKTHQNYLFRSFPCNSTPLPSSSVHRSKQSSPPSPPVASLISLMICLVAYKNPPTIQIHHTEMFPRLKTWFSLHFKCYFIIYHLKYECFSCLSLWMFFWCYFSDVLKPTSGLFEVKSSLCAPDQVRRGARAPGSLGHVAVRRWASLGHGMVSYTWWCSGVPVHSSGLPWRDGRPALCQQDVRWTWTRPAVGRGQAGVQQQVQLKGACWDWLRVDGDIFQIWLSVTHSTAELLINSPFLYLSPLLFICVLLF